MLLKKISNLSKGENERMKGIKSTKKVSKLQSFKMYLKKEMYAIAVLTTCILGGGKVAFAADAESKWDSMMKFIIPWITRLGGAVCLIGAIEFGLAFKNDDADGKTKGMRTLISGCIVIAVGAASDTFLK